MAKLNGKRGWRLRRSDVNSPEWGRLLESSSHLLFHGPVWARIMQEGLSGYPCCLLFEYEESVVGGMLGFFRRILWTNQLFLSVPYGGIVGKGPNGDVLAELLLLFGRKNGMTSINIVEWPDHRIAPSAAFNVVKGETQILSLNNTSFDSFWGGLKKRVRRDVRKAEKNGILVDKVRDEDGCRLFYQLYLEAMQRNRAIPKYGCEFVLSCFNHVIQPKLGEIFLGLKDGEAIAGIMVVDSGNLSHYLMGGSKIWGLQYCPNDLLLSWAIRRAIDQGMEGFDFLPSGPEDISLMAFKAKWGAHTKPVDTLTLVVKRLPSLAWKLTYGLLRRRPFPQIISRFRRSTIG